jgi:hypothetical protein
MNKGFKAGLLVGIFTIAIAVFENSQNGRYQYSINGNQGVVMDTRTGDFWTEDGSHFEPRTASITMHTPWIDDSTEGDKRSNSFRLCIQQSVKTPAACLEEKKLAEQAARESLLRTVQPATPKLDFQPDPSVPSASPRSH